MAKRLSLEDYSEPLGENPEVGTRFKPEPPYDDYQRGATYFSTQHGRRRVTLFGSKTDAAPYNTLLARYLYQVHLWKTEQRLIPEGYEVDHKDNDKMNDRIDNFQLLTLADNIAKKNAVSGRQYGVLICPVCGKHYDKPLSTTQYYPTASNDSLIDWHDLRCKITGDLTLSPYARFKDLRRWISKNQIYQIVRLMPDGERIIEQTLSEEMLNFNLAQRTGKSVDYGSHVYASPEERQRVAEDMRDAGATWQQIADHFHVSLTKAWEEFRKEAGPSEAAKAAKLAQMNRIKELVDSGHNYRQIAPIVGLSAHQVGDIYNRNFRNK